MDLPQALPVCSKEARTGASKGTQPTQDPKRRLLLAQEWLPLATFASRLPAMEDRLQLVQKVAHRRYLRVAQSGPARALANATGEILTAQRGDSRFSVGQDERGWWRTERLRWRQEGPRTQAALACGYGRLGTQSQSPQCQGPRPGRHQVASEGRSQAPSTPLASVGGCRLPGQGQGMGRAGAWAKCRGCASHAQANI